MSPLRILPEQLDTLARLAPALAVGGRRLPLLVSERLGPAGRVLVVEPDGGAGPVLVLAANGELRPDAGEYAAEPDVDPVASWRIVCAGCGRLSRMSPSGTPLDGPEHALDCTVCVPF